MITQGRTQSPVPRARVHPAVSPFRRPGETADTNAPVITPVELGWPTIGRPEGTDQAAVNPLAGSRILIVDDDRINVRILENILKTEGFEIAAGTSGEEALDVYFEFKPDLVLLDVMMPGLDGFETCREMRRRYGATAAPIIFITAKAESEDVVAGFTAGGVDYLPKPFRPKEALARIRTHLQNRRLLEELSAANSAKNRFLGMCAHDLRSPLASIRGLAEFLQDPLVGTLNDEQTELAGSIQTTAQSMLQLVNELLDVATIEAGELRLDLQPADLLEVLSKSVHLANLDAARKNTRIELLPASKPKRLKIDADKIRQVISNLLSNAVKYSPPGSLIHVSFSHTASEQSFAVLDQGPGIPDNERNLLFKDFGRLSTKPTAGEKSTGLGLAICRKIVTAHGGAIGVENRPEGGCSFSVTLPIPS